MSSEKTFYQQLSTLLAMDVLADNNEKTVSSEQMYFIARKYWDQIMEDQDSHWERIGIAIDSVLGEQQ